MITSARAVTFTVTQGGGDFNGQPSVTAMTDNSDGRALVVLTLGPEAGMKNHGIPLLQLPGTATQEVQHAVNAGGIVITPPHSIQYFDWNGIGYIVMSPETGAAGYFISGGLAGGSMALSVGKCINDLVEYVDTLPLPPNLLTKAGGIALEIMAFGATIHNILVEPVQDINKAQAAVLAFASLVFGIIGVYAAAEAGTIIAALTAIMITALMETALYNTIAILLTGGDPTQLPPLLESCRQLFEEP